jgi:GT2 family glycosyltransferase
MTGPAVSVIVPVWRDWDKVPALLSALAGQTLPAHEVILVDNEPALGPPVLPPPAGLPLRIVPCAAPGSYAARNAGIAAARGALLAFTDADCRPRPGWLAALGRAHAATPDHILAGQILMRTGPAPGWWEVFDAVRGMPQAAFVRRGYAATANLALSAPLMAKLGGFDPARLSGGDAAFCRRAGRLGTPLRLVPEAEVDHPARPDRATVEAKARRIKGGQVAAGPPLRRLAWTLRSLMPPLREIAGYLAAPQTPAAPATWRLIACAIRFRLWGVELAEVWRLLVLRRPPERR